MRTRGLVLLKKMALTVRSTGQATGALLTTGWAGAGTGGATTGGAATAGPPYYRRRNRRRGGEMRNSRGSHWRGWKSLNRLRGRGRQWNATGLDCRRGAAHRHDCFANGVAHHPPLPKKPAGQKQRQQHDRAQNHVHPRTLGNGHRFHAHRRRSRTRSVFFRLAGAAEGVVDEAHNSTCPSNSRLARPHHAEVDFVALLRRSRPGGICRRWR